MLTASIFWPPIFPIISCNKTRTMPIDAAPQAHPGKIVACTGHRSQTGPRSGTTTACTDPLVTPFSSPPKDGSLLRRDIASRQCVECRERNNRWGWHEYQSIESQMNSKGCLACKTTHPLAYFSRSQRYQFLPRRCIGHQGYVRLCEHEVIRWNSVVQAVNQLRRSERPARIQLVQCRHQSHLPSHHCPSTASENSYPSIVMEGNTLIMSWTGHMSLPTPTTPINNKNPIFTPTSISTHLNHFRTQQSGGAAEALAPLSAPGSPLPEMKCFDPARCSCLGLVNSNSINPSNHTHTALTNLAPPPTELSSP